MFRLSAAVLVVGLSACGGDGSAVSTKVKKAESVALSFVAPRAGSLTGPVTAPFRGTMTEQYLEQAVTGRGLRGAKSAKRAEVGEGDGPGAA